MAYDNLWYLTGGDIQGRSHVTYDVPTSLLIPLVDDPGYAYHPNRINTEIANQPDLTQIVAVADDDNLEDVKMLTPRRGMWIPNQYAALCLEEGLTPVMVWQRIYPMLLQNGHTVCCAPLVKFLQYQLAGVSVNNYALLTPAELTQPRTTPPLLRH